MQGLFLLFLILSKLQIQNNNRYKPLLSENAASDVQNTKRVKKKYRRVSFLIVSMFFDNLY